MVWGRLGGDGWLSGGWLYFGYGDWLLKVCWWVERNRLCSSGGAV